MWKKTCLSRPGILRTCGKDRSMIPETSGAIWTSWKPWERCRDGLNYPHGEAIFAAYTRELYRLFHEAAEKNTTKKVEVSLLGSIRKVTSNIQRFDFIQTKAVPERVLPRTLAISLRDGEELISNEAAFTFDSASAVLEERKKSVKLTLRAGL